MTEYKLNLHLFDGAEGGGAPATGGAEAAAAAESGAAVQQETQAQAVPTFEERMKALKDEFPDEHGKYMQSHLGRRMKTSEDAAKAAQAQLDAINPMLTTLAARYGVDASDPAAIAAAVEADATFLEDVAAQNGMSVEDYKAHMAQQRELEELRAFKQRSEDRADFERKMQAWIGQEQEAKAVFPDFNLQAELSGENGEQMLQLMNMGWPVVEAYKMLHVNELVSGAMAKTAQVVQEQTVNNIRARGMRPTENGAGGSNAAVSTKPKNPADMSRKERDALARRVMRGERVTFS